MDLINDRQLIKAYDGSSALLYLHNRTLLSCSPFLAMASPTRKGQGASTPRGSLQAPSAFPFPDSKPEIQPTTSDVKRKESRLPFLGRVRKKLSSNAFDSQPKLSDVRGPTMFLEPNSRMDLSTDQPYVALSNHLYSVLIYIFSSEAPPRPSQSSARTTRTLGSKLVSHLTPKKSRPKPPSGYASDTILPQPSSIHHSLEHANPRDSGSTTPRPSKPTITVSPSPTPTQLHDFQDLFTRPRRASAPKPSPSMSSHSRDISATDRVSASASLSESESSERRTWLSANSPSSGSPLSAHDVSLSSQSDTDTGSRTSDRVSTQSSRSSHLLVEPPVKSITSSDESDTTTNGLSIRHQRASTLATKTTDPALGNPPKLPLPVPNSPETSYPTPPPFSRTNSEPGVRSRAQTLAAIPSSRPNFSLKAARSISSIKLNADEIAASFDVESASPEQLKTEYIKRNTQYRDLAGILMSAREEHMLQRSKLEQRIVFLERDLARKDKEIKGLTWLMKNGSLPPSPPANSTSFSDSETRRLPRGGSGTPSRAFTVKHPQHRSLILVSQEDSAPESLSEASGRDSASSHRSRKLTGRSSHRASLPPRDSSILNSPLPPIPSSKRSSAASLNSTISSSSSIPSSSPTTLTSIPESPPVAFPSSKIRDPAIAAAFQAAEQFREKEQRRSSRRKPAPAAIVLPPTPAEAYAATLRRDGPTSSIAQVLDGKS
jgi:hypothetical protein